MEYDFREILDIGLEIEFSNIKRETPNFVGSLQKRLANFKHVHDASSETPELTISNIPIQFDINGKTNKLLSILRNRNLETYGGEINSPIMPSNDFRQNIYRLIDFLIDMGESFSTTEQDNRGSIHVHINVSKDIKHKHLIRLLELGLATEAIFYRLGGMGRINRGVENSFIYQRPLTLPPCLKYDNRYIPIFDYRDLLKTKTKLDFYNKYGDTTSNIRHGNHYVTQRYMGLNFYSIPYRGSIEFRYANKTLVPEWIIAWIILCQSFVNYSLTRDFDESFENTYRKLEDNRDIPQDEVRFIFEKLDIPEEYQITLLDIWRLSEVPQFNGKQALTHLPNPTFYSGNFGYLPKSVEHAEKVFVQDVRTENTKKGMQLMNLNKPVDLDYIIDATGVKTKLKGLGIRIDEERVNMDNFIRNWAIAGFNIQNYTEDDANEFVQNRILQAKFVPTRLLHLSEDYEFDTFYDDLKVIINVSEDELTVRVSFYNINTHQTSRAFDIATERHQNLSTHVFNITAFIENCRNHPQLYFDVNNDVQPANIDFDGEEIENINEEEDIDEEEDDNNNNDFEEWLVQENFGGQ